MNGFSRNGIGYRMISSTVFLGLLLGLSGCYEDGALLRSCYHAGARCGWNNDHGNSSDSSPPSPVSPGNPAPAPGPAPSPS